MTWESTWVTATARARERQSHITIMNEMHHMYRPCNRMWQIKFLFRFGLFCEETQKKRALLRALLLMNARKLLRLSVWLWKRALKMRSCFRTLLQKNHIFIELCRFGDLRNFSFNLRSFFLQSRNVSWIYYITRMDESYHSCGWVLPCPSTKSCFR